MRSRPTNSLPSKLTNKLPSKLPQTEYQDQGLAIICIDNVNIPYESIGCSNQRLLVQAPNRSLEIQMTNIQDCTMDNDEQDRTTVRDYYVKEKVYDRDKFINKNKAISKSRSKSSDNISNKEKIIQDINNSDYLSESAYNLSSRINCISLVEDADICEIRSAPPVRRAVQGNNISREEVNRLA